MVRFLSPELTVVLLPFAFLDAMNPGHAGAYWFESSLVHRAQTLRGQDDKALQGRRVEVCEVSAYPGDLDVEDHAISLDHCGIWIHDQNLSPLRGLSRKELQ